MMFIKRGDAEPILKVIKSADLKQEEEDRKEKREKANASSSETVAMEK